MEDSRIVRIKELVELLNIASKAYYQEDNEIMSNFEYDKLYDELVQLETDTGFQLSKSPTLNVGYEILSVLPKESHVSPMLSLDKTKEVASLESWIKDKEGILSWKLDGLTVVLTYKGGKLSKAVTRGNGEVGEVITNNAKVFANLPQLIPFKGELIVRGEAVITYSDFEIINSQIEDVESKYKNPRNLCSGSVRQLNNEVTAKRSVHFFAFTMLDLEDDSLGETVNKTITSKFKFLGEMGFEVVEYQKVTSENIAEEITSFSNRIKTNDFPSDGLVLSFDDLAYGKSLGRTAKFPRDAIAFKWADEEAETKLREIFWSPSRTGLINPVAIFEPVELEGTTVSRASIHNISILKGLELGIGDRITVYKANMIIPQISSNITRSGNVIIPDICPACGEKTRVKNENDVETLICTNSVCPAKSIKLFSHFVSRNAMNIEGISEATLEKFIDKGYLKQLFDLYRLDLYKDEIIALEGFGIKSYENMIKSIEGSRNTVLANFINGLGILNVGLTTAKLLCKNFKNDFEALRNATLDDLVEIDQIGKVIGEFIIDYFADEGNNYVVDELLKEINIIQEINNNEQDLEGYTFVITGSLERFSNRDELKKLIEDRGGKVTGSVTTKTTHLINNDINSSSSKNKKAKSLNIPIITEEDFLNIE